MIQIENTWVQKKVVPNLNIQVLYMSGPYLPKGADQEMVEKWLSEENHKEPDKPLTITPAPTVVSFDPYVILECQDPEATIYCFFDYSIKGIKYPGESQEFTELYKAAKSVLSYAFGPLGVSKTVKLK